MMGFTGNAWKCMEMHGLDASIEKNTEQKLKFHDCMRF